MPTLAQPVSQLCTQSQCEEQIYYEWCRVLGLPNFIHRKWWEFVYLARAFGRAGLLKPGKCGIGFGVGQEPLPKYFVDYRVAVTATDLPNGETSAWAKSDQWANAAQGWPVGVTFRAVDMNAIPPDLRRGEFDFAWSACALDHLGTLQHGLDFIRASLECVKPGGVVAHTTEFNLTSDMQTLETGPVVLYREHDLTAFCAEMNARGHTMALDLTRGDGPYDGRPEVEPHPEGTRPPHLCVAIGGFITTSVGLTIRKAA